MVDGYHTVSYTSFSEPLLKQTFEVKLLQPNILMGCIHGKFFFSAFFQVIPTLL